MKMSRIGRFHNSELVIGLVGAVGSELFKVAQILEERLKRADYETIHIKISKDIIPLLIDISEIQEANESNRISNLMDAGNKARKNADDNSILALGAASKISSLRYNDDGQPKPRQKTAYIINSLKHPEEVLRLRDIYPRGFYLIGVHSDKKRRLEYLTNDKGISDDDAKKLINRDEYEKFPYGQHVADTFHMSDFFVRDDGTDDRLKNSLWRIVDILFGDPFRTPTFDEYAMFLAFAASLRSADLSRQVGAVIGKKKEVIATGANDCPQYGGGLYWPIINKENGEISDSPDGRDYMRGKDSNTEQQKIIIDEIIEKGEKEGLDASKLKNALECSRIRDLTEYGRVVHAEMEALLSCARNQISAREGTLYCTVYPCHNCAKHIIAAGINRVVYIEPYHKSKAQEFHSESLCAGFEESDDAVNFEPFVGVGPRLFFDLFSMKLGSGLELKRKDGDGNKIDWKLEDSQLRLQMNPSSYLQFEDAANKKFKEVVEFGREEKDND